jgi:subtilisin family serine protease
MDDNMETTLPHLEIHEEISSLSQVIDWGLKQLNVPSTWTITKGEGITAMVIDTGHPVHPDIGENAIEGKNCIPGEPLEDENGHHTHCTGIICAKHNETGMVGVAPEAKCISVKALAKNGSGSYQGLADALDYAIEMKPDVVSMSLGGSAPSPILESRIKKLYEMNIPVVCAAGNTGTGGVNWPAAYDETIAIAAYDKYGNVASFSSKGDKVEWAAPGVNIYSTFLNNGYASLSGTSMACPFITGVICLMLAKHKKQEDATGMNDCKTIEQIREHLLKYTKDKGAMGRDNSWGYGVIDVEKLIKIGDEPYNEEPVKEEPINEEPVVEEPVVEEPKDEEPPLPTPPPPPVEEPVEEEPVKEPVETPKKKKNTMFIVIGVVVVVAIIGIALVMNNKVDIPEPPYFDDNGEINWDKKYQHDIK